MLAKIFGFIAARLAEPSTKAAIAGAIGALVAALLGQITPEAAAVSVVLLLLPALTPEQAKAVVTEIATLAKAARKVGPALILVVAAGALSACQSPGTISAGLPQDIAAAVPESGPAGIKGTVTQGLVDTAWNLDEAIAVGALDRNDPAPGCLDAVLGDLGIGKSAGLPLPSFTPKVSDLISGGSVLYIRAQQAKRLAGGGIELQIPCQALVGKLVIDAAKAGINAGASLVPGAGLLQRVTGALP
jgi:hypothetical protein